jgi:hypothetical protein
MSGNRDRDRRDSFRLSFLMSDAPMLIASSSDLLADVQLRPAWDGASISPANAEYPRVHVVGSGNSGRWIPEILAPSPETLAV